MAFRRRLKGKEPPAGWDLIEQSVEDFEQQMRDAVAEEHEGAPPAHETPCPILIPNQHFPHDPVRRAKSRRRGGWAVRFRYLRRAAGGAHARGGGDGGDRCTVECFRLSSVALGRPILRIVHSVNYQGTFTGHSLPTRCPAPSGTSTQLPCKQVTLPAPPADHTSPPPVRCEVLMRANACDPPPRGPDPVRPTALLRATILMTIPVPPCSRRQAQE